ncbi:MAG: rod shape-determining protein RodA [Desulfobacterota bacterium]|nr:rod shape-determining protein RodA [Thermodesulfobacteriota bacterium]MDW8002806.1 rod shape-determining protein RodA [Deltaproteobacteria bacterium]
MIDKRRLHHIDLYLIANVLGIFAIGMLTLISATSSLGSKTFVLKQILAFFIGLIFVTFILYFDYRTFVSYAFYLYIFGLFLILLVFLFGTVAGGARRWLSIFGLSLQPSEFMKPILIILFGNLLHEKMKSGSPLGLKDVAKPLLFSALPASIIAKQPDLGTACVILIVCLCVIWFVGLKKSTFFVLLFSGFTLAFLAWKYALEPYQKLRIIGLFNPDIDPSGVNYHARQATIAIGSGKVFGKGFLSGTQHKLNFIPEHHTDFIFAVFAEEWGFLGSIFLFILFASMVLRCLKIAKDTQDEMGSIIVFGSTTIIFSQFAINVLMTLRLFPVVGIPLPFLSYGGSSLVSMMCLIGLILNVNMRRYMF